MATGTNDVSTFPRNYQTIRMVNCAGCRKELVGLSHKSVYSRMVAYHQNLPELMHNYIDGRPYCVKCAKWINTPSPYWWVTGVSSTRPSRDLSPGWDNVIRALEEDK